MPGLLYEYDQDEDADDFVLTPDYDQLLAEFAAREEYPTPIMGDQPEFHFDYYLKLVNPKPKKRARRGSNGRFTKREDLT